MGASKVYAYITHPVLSGPAIDNIASSALDELVVTDTILSKPAAPVPTFACSAWRPCWPKRFAG